MNSSPPYLAAKSDSREQRRSTGGAGTTLEWSDDRYRGDAIAFVIENAAQILGLGRHLDAGALGVR